MHIKVANPFAPHAAHQHGTGGNPPAVCGGCPVRSFGTWCGVRAMRIKPTTPACEYGFRAMRAARLKKKRKAGS